MSTWGGSSSLPTLAGATGDGFARRSASVILAVIVALAVLGWIGLASLQIELTVTAHGRLEPRSVHAVRSLEDGIVTTVLVEPGERVRRGDTLALLDSLDLSSELREIESGLERLQWDERVGDRRTAAARASLLERSAASRAELRRALASLVETMTAHGLGRDADGLLADFAYGRHVALDRAVAGVHAAAARMAQDSVEAANLDIWLLERARIRSGASGLGRRAGALQQRRERLAVRAPADGTVLTDRTHEALGRFVRRGEAVLEIGDVSGWYADLIVPAGDVYDVVIGNAVKLDILPLRGVVEGQVEGRVVEVSLQASPTTPSGNEGTFRARVLVPTDAIPAAARERLRRGYRVRGEILTRAGRVHELFLARLRREVR